MFYFSFWNILFANHLHVGIDVSLDNNHKAKK